MRRKILYYTVLYISAVRDIIGMHYIFTYYLRNWALEGRNQRKSTLQQFIRSTVANS